MRSFLLCKRRLVSWLYTCRYSVTNLPNNDIYNLPRFRGLWRSAVYLLPNRIIRISHLWRRQPLTPYFSGYVSDTHYNSDESKFQQQRICLSGEPQKYSNCSFAIVFLGLIFAVPVFTRTKPRIAFADVSLKETGPKPSVSFREDLPIYTLHDVENHTTEVSGMWVRLNNGVYDITKFISIHPGGQAKISLARGCDLQAFWNLYTFHDSTNIHQLLEELRIGNFVPTEDEKHRINNYPLMDGSEIYSKEPRRHPALDIVSNRPFNAETPASILVDSFVTPNELFFIRNHLPVPSINIETYSVNIDGAGRPEPVSLTIRDLKDRYENVKITCTTQCAGNRRNTFQTFKPLKGLPWKLGAIGTTTWTGARLADVLKSHGITSDQAKLDQIKHVQFEGMDCDDENNFYGASITIGRALDENADVLLAYEMNGQEIPRDHGFPLRVVVPGVVGARSVKWLKSIILSGEESRSFWQKNDYRVFSPSINWNTVDWNTAPAIQEYPVQSGICEPLESSTFDDQDEGITVSGYAWSGGGRAIVRVEVSIDNGLTWHGASLKTEREPTTATEEENFQHLTDWNTRSTEKAWAWVLWTVEVPIPSEKLGKPITICSRAVDASYNTQPESPGPIWNLRGCLCNSWHAVTILPVTTRDE